jgi:hypothetical protein
MGNLFGGSGWKGNNKNSSVIMNRSVLISKMIWVDEKDVVEGDEAVRLQATTNTNYLSTSSSSFAIFFLFPSNRCSHHTVPVIPNCAANATVL